MTLNIKRLNNLLQYILIVAGQNDSFERELGNIHLVKYVYLADLTYAKRHGGETFTGLTWIFHHFGPWSVECFKQIEPALVAISANRKTVESAKYDDLVRWSSDNYGLFEQLTNQMDIGISGAIQTYVRKFGNDTYGLLDFIYKTEPMVNASPEERLDFKHAIVSDITSEEGKALPKLTARQKKKRQQEFKAFKEKLTLRLAEKLKSYKTVSCPLPPQV